MLQLFLLVLFFFSGVSALIYQTLWIRQFGLVFGVDIFAASTVLTAFMAGLALGSYLFGRLVDRNVNPLKLFAALELGIGLFALLFPFSFKGLDWIYLALYRALPLGFYATQLYRFVLAFLFLMIPTMLMGGTLPVLSKVFVKKMQSMGWNVGKLYSVNNLGALVGCFLAGFILIRWIGQQNSMMLAAAFNLFNAGMAFLLYRRVRMHDEPIPPPSLPALNRTASMPDYVIRFVMWAFAVEGFAALAYEVIWTRILLGFSYDKSVYFYSTVIFTFIFGLSFGSILMAKVTDRNKNLLLLFARIEIAIGVLAIILLTAFARIANILNVWRLEYGDNWWGSLGREYLLFFMVMVIPATLMGMIYPIVSRLCTPHLKRLGTRLGEIGFLDTVGSIFGAFVAGFVMIPFLGVAKAVIITAVINIGIGIIAVLIEPAAARKSKGIWIGAVLVVFIALMVTLPNSNYFRHWQTRRPGDRLLFYKEGPDAAIAVPQHSDGTKFLAINGSVTAFAEFGDIRVHKMLGCLPALLHEKPDTALVIGLGMGITARSLLATGIHQVDCVEINSGVVDACAGYFTDVNQSVLNDPRVNLIVDDGRSYLHMTKKKYDIITTNAVHARLSGNLYTREFYEICRQRLQPNGVMCQWTSTNWLTPKEFKSLITAFQSVFPHTSLWLVNAGHLLIIGIPNALQINMTALTTRMAEPQIQADLSSYSLGTPELLLAHFVMDEEILPTVLKKVPVNSDDRPYAELSRVVSKMQIPEIVLEFIHDKTNLSKRLSFTNKTEDEKQSLMQQVANYSLAEKYYLEGAFAENMYNQPLLALNMLTQALQLQPNDYRYHEEAASVNLILAQQERLSEKERNIFLDNSIAHLEAMTIAVPDFAFDWNNLGYVYMNRGRLADAERAFRRAIELAPDNPMPRNYLASIVGGRGELAEAESLLKAAIHDYPDEVESYYRLGLVYELMKKPQDAHDAFMQAVSRDPSYRDAYQKLQNTGRSKS
jgi:spermidine synthase